MAPHELTKAEFQAAAQVEALVNHGRKWNVTLGTYSSFSDAETPEAAKDDAHRGAVNNALYLNCPDAPQLGSKPSVPPLHVLVDYPELIVEFREALLTPQQSPAQEPAVVRATLTAAVNAATTVVLEDYEVDPRGLCHEGDVAFERFEYDDMDWYLPANQEVEINEEGECSVQAYIRQIGTEPETVTMRLLVSKPICAIDIRSTSNVI